MKRYRRRDPASIHMLEQTWRNLLKDSNSETWVGDAFVFADALIERGYPRLANRISKWTREAERYYRVKAAREPVHVRFPSVATWKSIVREVDEVLRELKMGRPDVHWWTMSDRGKLTSMPVTVLRHSDGFTFIQPLLGSRKGQTLAVERSEVTSYRPRRPRLAAGAKRFVEP